MAEKDPTVRHVSPQVQTVPTAHLENMLNKHRMLTNEGELTARISVRSKLPDFESVLLDNIFAPLSHTWERVLAENEVFVDPTRHFLKTKKYTCAVTSSLQHMANLYKRFVHIKMWLAERNPKQRRGRQSTPKFAILGNENLSNPPSDSKNDYSVPSTINVPPPQTEVAKPQLEKLAETPEVPISLKVSKGRGRPKGRSRIAKTESIPTIHEDVSNQIGCDRQQEVEEIKTVWCSSLEKTEVQTRPRRQNIPPVFYVPEDTFYTPSKTRKTRAVRVPKVSGAQGVANQSKTLQNKIQQSVKSVTVPPATESWTLANQALPICEEVQVVQISNKLVEPLKLVRKIIAPKKREMQVVKPLEISEISAPQLAAENQNRQVNYEKENVLKNATVAPIIEKSNETTLRNIAKAQVVNSKPPPKAVSPKAKRQKKTSQTVEQPKVLRLETRPSAKVRSRSADPSRLIVKPSKATSLTQGSSSGPPQVQAVKTVPAVSLSQNTQENALQLLDTRDPTSREMRTKAKLRSRSSGADTLKSRVSTELVANSRKSDGQGNKRKRGFDEEAWRFDDAEYKKRICNYWCRLAPYEYRKMQQEIYGLKNADDEYQIVKRLPYTFTIFLTAMNVK